MPQGKWIVVDLDGTLCNCDHRVAYAQTSQWDEFHSRCVDDKPNSDVQELVRFLQQRYHVLVVSGRSAKWLTQTQDWLMQHKVPVDNIRLRPDGDFTPDVDLKLRLIEDFFAGKNEVLKSVIVALEDRDKVVEAFRNYGINTWQVREGTY